MGLIDSPFQHVTEWEQRQVYMPHFPELNSSEYQEVPRGRVVYSATKQRAIVYMDRSIFNDAYKQKIKTHFDLLNCKVSWKADPHYRIFGNADHSVEKQDAS